MCAIDPVSGPRGMRRSFPASAGDRAFLGMSLLLFAAGATASIVGGVSMSAMGGMPMPGGWTLSMTWTRGCGQTWPGVATGFLGMWMAMMPAMMLPSLGPTLWRYRDEAGRAGAARPGLLAALAGTGYFLVWNAVGVAVFPLGAAVATVELQHPTLARAVPALGGAVVLLAGALQFSSWKRRRLIACAALSGGNRAPPACAAAAWRAGLRLGWHCSASCVGFTAILLVLGAMDLRVTALVTLAITAERLVPTRHHASRTIGLLTVVAGGVLIVGGIEPA